jgi:hypothetical protein
MPAALCLTAEHVEQLERFAADMRAAGRTPWPTTQQAARTFGARAQRAGGFERMPLARQLEAVERAPAFAAWLMVSGRPRASAELIDRANLRLGIAARSYLPAAHRWFCQAAEEVGDRPADISAQWSTLAKVTALTGVAPDTISDAEFEAARSALLAAFSARAAPEAGRNLAASFHRLRLDRGRGGPSGVPGGLKDAPVGTIASISRVNAQSQGVRYEA